MRAEINTPQKISWIVAHRERRIIANTRSWVRSLVPQSPRTNFFNQSQYWTTMGLLSPSRMRSDLIASAAVRDARRCAVGSNVVRTNEKSRNDAINTTGIV